MLIIKRKLARLIPAFTLIIALLISMLPARAFAVTQADIDALRAKRNEITAEKDAKQAEIDELQSQQASVMEQKQALDERNEYTLEQMRLNQEEIDYYDEIIAQKAQELAEALALEQEQLECYRVRVRAMEEHGTYNILSLILKSNNLGELLTTIDDVEKIMQTDRDLEDAYILARQHTEAVKAEYEATKAELEAKQDELRAEQLQLEKELNEATDLILQLTEDIEANSAILQELQAQEDAADEHINELVAELERQRLEEERRRQEAAQQAAQQQGNSGGGSSSGGTAVGTGSFAWPVACTYITSCVGYRYHPVSGEWKYHSGMDIGASYGSTVWASDGGTVTVAGENGGYGNCVMIDHGNGYYTLYGHLSSIAVSCGSWVDKGTTVGYVGSTGIATGPHLHFEIRDGSGALDFSGWFSGLTYAPDSGG